jgi:hypothetical protein
VSAFPCPRPIDPGGIERKEDNMTIIFPDEEALRGVECAQSLAADLARLVADRTTSGRQQ